MRQVQRVGIGHDDQGHAEAVGEPAHADPQLEPRICDGKAHRPGIGDDADGHVDLVGVLPDSGRIEHDELAAAWRRVVSQPHVQGDF